MHVKSRDPISVTGFGHFEVYLVENHIKKHLKANPNIKTRVKDSFGRTGFDVFQNLPSQFDLESFKCHECDVSFTDAAEAVKHLMSHLPKESYDDIEKNVNDEYDPGELDLGEFSSENESETRRKYTEMANQHCDIECPNCNENFTSMIAWGNHFNDVHKKCDDISVSKNVENNSTVDLGSTSQHNADKSDDIPVSTSGENVPDIDFDPPSPVYKVRNLKRIRANSYSESDLIAPIQKHSDISKM